MSNTKQFNTKDITLSVGIPTYNQAQFLTETLDSLLAQTRPPDEIVVSDHHSTDNTQEVLASYAPRLSKLCRFKIIQPAPGSNLTAQYNFTLASLSGDWITLLSSDDIAYPNYGDVLHRVASANPAAALVRCGWQQIDRQGKVTTTNYLMSVPKLEDPPSNLTNQQYGPKVSFAAFAIRREAFLQCGPILSSIESLADWALFLQIAPFGSFVYEHALISGYRVGHDGNKDRDRIAPWVRDQQRIFNEVMPLAAQRCGINDLAWIGEASAYNYTRYLARASRQFAPHEREPVAAVFRSWAESLPADNAATAQKLLEAFAKGAVTPTSLPLTRRLKNYVRPLYQRLHFLLRRSG